MTLLVRNNSSLKTASKINGMMQTTTPVVSACPEEKQRIPNQETWMLLRRAYFDAIGKSWNAEKEKKDGIQVSYEIKMDSVRGRGFFLTEDVEEGTRIMRSENVAKFEDRETFITFLEAIPHEFQCDILLWAYPEEDQASVDLDGGSFVNHSDDPAEINMNVEGYATRDIRKGEMILMDYNTFIDYGDVPWFDEIRTIAWAEQKKEGEQLKVYESTESYNWLGAPRNTGAAADSIKTSPRSNLLRTDKSQLHVPPVATMAVFLPMVLVSTFVARKSFFGRSKTSLHMS